jgi:HSP20 family molecular chaperone IbpA
MSTKEFRMLSDLLDGIPPLVTNRCMAYPGISFNEEKNVYEVTMDIPGVDPDKGVTIRVEDNRMYVSTVRDGAKYKEYVFNIPKKADSNDITASCKLGVLTLSLPRVEPVGVNIKWVK